MLTNVDGLRTAERPRHPDVGPPCQRGRACHAVGWAVFTEAYLMVLGVAAELQFRRYYDLAKGMSGAGHYWLMVLRLVTSLWFRMRDSHAYQS